MKTVKLGMGIAALAIAVATTPSVSAQSTTDVPSTTVGVRKPKPGGGTLVTGTPSPDAQQTTDLPSTTVGVRKPKPGGSLVTATPPAEPQQTTDLPSTTIPVRKPGCCALALSAETESSTTDANGALVVTWVPAPGDKGLEVGVDRSRLKVAVMIRIEAGRQVLVSAPILPGEGTAWASSPRGVPLLAPRTGEGSQSVKVTLTEAPGQAGALREVKPIVAGSVVIRRSPPRS